MFKIVFPDQFTNNNKSNNYILHKKKYNYN